MKVDEEDSIIDKNISLKNTSICAFKCVLNPDKRDRNIARDSSNTSGTVETPFFESATHKYCLIAFRKVEFRLNSAPAF